MITNVVKLSDFEIEFQLEDQDDVVVDVDDILDINVKLIHTKLQTLIAEYELADLDLDNTDNTIHVFIEHTETNERRGNYLMKVWWEVANGDFSGGTMETIDQAVVFNLV